MPPALIIEHSKSLDELMHEHDGDAAKSSIALEDFDEDTFARFVEYLYTGEYAAAKPTTRVQSIEGSAAEDSDEELTPAMSIPDHDERCRWRSIYSDWNRPRECTCGLEDADTALEAQVEPEPEPTPIRSSLKTSMKSKPLKASKVSRTATKQKPEHMASPKSTSSDRMQAWATFKALDWPQAKKEAKGSEYSARPNENEDEDYGPVFLSHARLHVFACVYDISRLKVLTLMNLHKTLVAFTIFNTCAQNVAELLVYCYRERGADSSTEIRELVNDYVACNIQKLMEDVAFKNAVRGCEEAAFDLFALVIERMQVQE